MNLANSAMPPAERSWPASSARLPMALLLSGANGSDFWSIPPVWWSTRGLPCRRASLGRIPPRGGHHGGAYLGRGGWRCRYRRLCACPSGETRSRHRSFVHRHQFAQAFLERRRSRPPGCFPPFFIIPSCRHGKKSAMRRGCRIGANSCLIAVQPVWMRSATLWKTAMQVSVVIPVLNEENNVEPLLSELEVMLRGWKQVEVICVDDHSTDRTLDVLKSYAAEHPWLRIVRHHEQSGQSAAVRSGVQAARYPLIATLDGDGQNDPNDVAQLVA
ncbi:MAG: glycosyltransferase family 2 protein, partial [Chloroflexia bacterium]|nr:glycosyltransferase family 2 protein [Chloroflexia bacterium]